LESVGRRMMEDRGSSESEFIVLRVLMKEV
jgi:hypothetical protein